MPDGGNYSIIPHDLIHTGHDIYTIDSLEIYTCRGRATRTSTTDLLIGYLTTVGSTLSLNISTVYGVYNIVLVIFYCIFAP